MESYIKKYTDDSIEALKLVSIKEIAKAINIIQSVYERDGRIYIFGNGGSLALATHWVSDFNKTVFSHNLDFHAKRFQAIRLPSTEEELSAWANDVGFEMVFAGPLQNYLQESDCVIAISSSGNSANIIQAVKLAKKRHVPVVGLSGFDGGKLNELADASILVKTEKGQYGIVEGSHAVILHLIITYFQNYFDHLTAHPTVIKQKKVAFLDRDGIINKKAAEHCYIKSVNDFVFNDGVFTVLKDLQNKGFEIIIVTNQRGIARGLFSEADLASIHNYMLGELGKMNIKVLDIFYCPHEHNVCECRKPKSGLLKMACKKYNIDLESSVLLSDSAEDVEMGKNFGVGKNYLLKVDEPKSFLNDFI